MIHDSGPPDRHGARREIWLVALLFTALTILLAYPLSIHPWSLRFPTGPDGDLGWYLLGWNTHAFFHKPWAIFDANIYYPERLTLAFGENIIGLALFAAPVIWLTGNLLLAANFVSMLSTMLCGLGAYVLARRVGLTIAAAALTGIIFECAPPRFFRIGQINLSSVQWIPFALAALHAYLDEGKKRDLRLAAGCISLQTLSSGHGAVLMGVALLTFGLYRLVLGEPIRPIKWTHDFGIVGALLLAPSVLVFLPYLAVQKDVGLKRGLGSWVANYDSFLASPSHLHQFVLSVFDQELEPLAYLFPGYLPLVLAVAALLVWRRSKVAAPTAPAATVRKGTGWAVEIALLISVAAAAIVTARYLMELRVAALDPPDPLRVQIAWVIAGGVAAIAFVWRNPAAAIFAAPSRRFLSLALAAGLGWVFLGIARPALPAGNGLRAEYFRNAIWDGGPVLTAADKRLTIDHVRKRWKGSLPERFSVRWTGFLAVPRAGLYEFTTTSDDGSQLFLDGKLVVDNGGPHGYETQTGRVYLDRGAHPLTLTYVQFGGDLGLNWSWSREGSEHEEIPAWALSQRRPPLGTVMAARALDWCLPGLAILSVIGAFGYIGSTLLGWPAMARWTEARRRDATTFYAVLALVTFGLALGPPYGLWQYVYWLPGFNFIRESSRFTIVGLLALAMLAGIGFDKLTRRLPHRRRTVLAIVAAVILVAEYAAMPMAVQPSNFEIPAIDRWLDTLPKPFVVAEVPLRSPSDYGEVERRHVAYMIHSTAHWQKTVHGYSGWRTLFHHQLYEEMQSFPDEISLKSLTDLGVNYVVAHTDLYAPEEWAGVEERLTQFASRVRLEHVEGPGRVYSLLASKPDAVD